MKTRADQQRIIREDKEREETDKVLRRLDKKLAPRIQAFRESERLSEADFSIRINALEP